MSKYGRDNDDASTSKSEAPSTTVSQRPKQSIQPTTDAKPDADQPEHTGHEKYQKDARPPQNSDPTHEKYQRDQPDGDAKADTEPDAIPIRAGRVRVRALMTVLHDGMAYTEGEEFTMAEADLKGRLERKEVEKLKEQNR